MRLPGSVAGPDEPPLSPSPPNLPGNLTERYHLLGEIGRGGMGTVLRGHDPALGRDLAIKVLLADAAARPDLCQRFRKEAQVAGQLQHPGVVPVYELGACGHAQPYFAMKLVKGRTLVALLEERADPSQERQRFLKVFEQVCQAVGYAHSKGVLHRDLKPSNVMVGDFGEVQVMDWGLAKLFGSDVSPTTGQAPATAAGVVKVVRPEAAGSGTHYRKALALQPDFALAYYNLGILLAGQNNLAAAETACRKATELQPDYALAYLNLGSVLAEQKKSAEAETAYRQAIALQPECALAYYNLGSILSQQKKLTEAQVAFRKCLEMTPHHAEAHCNLGHTLRNQGRFVHAVASLRRGHSLGSTRPDWPYPSEQWVQQAQQLLDLDRKLAAVLQGQAKPDSAAEQLGLAWLCAQPYKQRYATAVRFYAEAFAADPKWAECVCNTATTPLAPPFWLPPARAKTPPRSSAKEQTRLRQQALTWLQADLAADSRLADKAAARLTLRQLLPHWLADTDLTGVAAPALAALPAKEGERGASCGPTLPPLLQRVEAKK